MYGIVRVASRGPAGEWVRYSIDRLRCRVGGFQEVSGGSKCNSADGAEEANQDEKWQPAQERCGARIARDHEGKVQAEAIQGAGVQRLSLAAPEPYRQAD